MAEPARKNNYEDNPVDGIMKSGRADDYSDESRQSNLMRQARAKARQDSSSKNKITNLDDYRAQRNQARQNAGPQADPSVDQGQAGSFAGEGVGNKKEDRPSPFEGASVDPALLRQQQGGGEEDRAKEGEAGQEGGASQSDEESDAAKMNAGKKAKRDAGPQADPSVDQNQAGMKGVGMGIRMGTNRALRWAWIVLLPSWGLSLIYINLHVILRWIIGESFFCKLGREWIPLKVKAITNKAGEKTGKMIGIVEVIVLLILDLAALFIILGILGIFSIIVQFATASLWDKAGMIWKFKDEAFSSIKALYDLFAGIF